MAKIYTCKLTDSIIFNLKADSESDARDYLNTHTAHEIMDELKCNVNFNGELQYNEEIISVGMSNDYDIEIASGSTLTDARQAEIFNNIIDNLIEYDGLNLKDTIEILVTSGATKDELLALSFNRDTVESYFSEKDGNK